MDIGIIQTQDQFSDLVVTNSAVLVPTDMVFTATAGARYKGRIWLPFNVGATGGLRFRLACVNAPTTYELTATINNTVAPAVTPVALVAEADINLPLANAGDHFAVIDFYIHANLQSDIAFQVAQDTADPLSLTVLKGAFLMLAVL